MVDGEIVLGEIKILLWKLKWYDIFNYIVNFECFCGENLKKYGFIFKISVFGGMIIFVGSVSINKMVFNGDNKYIEIILLVIIMEMFGEYSLF